MKADISLIQQTIGRQELVYACRVACGYRAFVVRVISSSGTLRSCVQAVS